MNDDYFLQQYIDATQNSTNRTRQVLLVMIVASIVAFTAFWNSRGNGWVSYRLALAKASYEILRTEAEGRSKERDNTASEKTEPLPEIKGPLEDAEIYKTAREFARGRTVEQARESLMLLQRIRAEQVSQIRVPVFGSSFDFDVNDLGFLGGVTFIVLLIWVNYSLWHHSNNLSITFDLARKLQRKPG